MTTTATKPQSDHGSRINYRKYKPCWVQRDLLKTYHGDIICKIQIGGDATCPQWAVSWTNELQKNSKDGRKIYRLRDALTNCNVWTLFGFWPKQSEEKWNSQGIVNTNCTVDDIKEVLLIVGIVGVLRLY